MEFTQIVRSRRADALPILPEMQTRIIDKASIAPRQNLSKQIAAIFERRNANVDVEFFRLQNHLAPKHRSFCHNCPSAGYRWLGKTIEYD